MAFITETLAGDKRIQLGSEDFVRKLGFGNSWQIIRIMLRLSILDNPSNITTNLAVGVCNGYGYNSSNPLADFYGLDNIGGSVVYTRGATDYNPPTANFVGYRNLRKVGGVVGVNSAAAATNNRIANSGGTAGATGWVIQLTRTVSPGASTCKLEGWMGGSPLTTISRYTALTDAEGATTGITVMGALNTATLAVGDSYDYLNISWGASTPALEISDITVVRMT